MLFRYLLTRNIQLGHKLYNNCIIHFCPDQEGLCLFYKSVSRQRLDDSLCVCNLEGRMVVSGSELMSMPFEIFSVYVALVLFLNMSYCSLFTFI